MNNMMSAVVTQSKYPKPTKLSKCDCGTSTYAKDGVCTACRVQDRVLKKILALAPRQAS